MAQIDQNTASQEVLLDDQIIMEFMENKRAKQNIINAVLAGLAASLVGAFLWAIITIATEYQIGFMAIGVGLLVGFAVRKAGNGVDNNFGFIGAGLALFGCALGNMFTMIGFTSIEFDLSYFEVYDLFGFSGIFSAMGDSFGAMDIFFYGIAAWEGYKFSIAGITEEEQAELIRQQQNVSAEKTVIDIEPEVEENDKLLDSQS